MDTRPAPITRQQYQRPRTYPRPRWIMESGDFVEDMGAGLSLREAMILAQVNGVHGHPVRFRGVAED